MATETENVDEKYGKGSQPPTLLTEGQMYNKLHPDGQKYRDLRKSDPKHAWIIEARDKCVVQRHVYDKDYALWKSNNAAAASELEKKQAEDKARRQLQDKQAKEKRKLEALTKTDDTESESEKEKPKVEEVKKKVEPAASSKKGKKTVESDDEEEEELDMTPKPKKVVAAAPVVKPVVVAATPEVKVETKTKKKAPAPITAEKTPPSKGAPDMAKTIQEAKAKTTKPVITQSDVKVPGESVNGVKPAAKSSDAKKRSKNADAEDDHVKDGVIASIKKRFKIILDELVAVEKLTLTVVEALDNKIEELEGTRTASAETQAFVTAFSTDMRGRVSEMAAIVSGLERSKSTK